MFAIVISEKGGAERRELFDKHEINVGRVQGNDLLLPKGNVSKRHARLMFRDGRFIVTDLKSTNGTYVNGRKIAQATIVREGDKIYVGDFVLRVELTASAPSSGANNRLSSVSADAPAPPPGAAALAAAQAANAARPPLTFDAEFTARHESLGAATHPPPDSGEPVGRPTSHDLSDYQDGAAQRSTTPMPAVDSPRDAAALRASLGSAGPTLVPRLASNELPPPTPPAERMVTSRALALQALVDRVAEAIDLAPLARGAEPDQVLGHRIERLVRDKAKALCDDGLLPESIDIDDVIRDAQRELLGLGALESLIEDDEVTEIRAFSHNHLTAVKNGEVIDIDPPFSSESALFRAIVRLCRQSPVPLAKGETIVERHLPRGLLMQAILPPTSHYGHALVLRKRRRAEVGLDDLVRSGTISRAMATFLNNCILARVNVLLVGPPEGTSMLLSALVSAGDPRDRVVALQSVDELWGIEPAPISIRLPEGVDDAVHLVRSAARLRPERLVISPLAGPVAAAVTGCIAEGAEGVLATVWAPSLRHALERLVPDLMAARPGMAGEAARSWLLGSFELAVEVVRLRDGRHRMLRVAELYAGEGGLQGRDIFTFGVERTAAGGAVEGTFASTGVVPRIAEDLAARGNAFDSALFKRDRG